MRGACWRCFLPRWNPPFLHGRRQLFGERHTALTTGEHLSIATGKSLQACYMPNAEELDWATRSTRGQGLRLGSLVLLKVFQQPHYFPSLDGIPTAVIDHVRASAGLDPDAEFGCPGRCGRY